MSERVLLSTINGEAFQPVRLHYRVQDHTLLQQSFMKLRCVDRDEPRGRWVWLYDFEAKGLKFRRSFAQIPAHLRPIVLGAFFLRGDTLLLDLRSCERGVQAVLFFDKHLPRRAVEVTHADVVNRLFSTENPRISPEDIFDHEPCTVIDPEEYLRNEREVASAGRTPQEKLKLAMEYSREQSKRNLPAIERMPLHFYSEGIGQFETSLKMRQIVAMKHWQGETDYRLFDVIQSAAGAFS